MSDAGATPSVSVVVCTRDRPDVLERCLDSLSAIDYPAWDVIVVDNAPANGGVQAIAERWKASYVVEPLVGLSRARNTGVSVSTADVVAYLDDDSMADPGWLGALGREFADPEVMAVAGRILPLRVRTNAERLGGAVGWEWVGAGAERRCIEQSVANWPAITLLGGTGAGGNMAFRRSVFEHWSGFDVRLGRGAPISGGEEHHAFFSLVARGFRIVYTPDAVVRHPYPETMDQLRDKYLADRTTAAAYMTMLLVEEPRARRPIARWLFETPLRRRANARHVQSRRAIVPRWQSLLALIRGTTTYARSRLSASVRSRR